MLGLGLNLLNVSLRGAFNAASYGDLYFEGGSISGNTLFSKTGDDDRELLQGKALALDGSLTRVDIPEFTFEDGDSVEWSGAANNTSSMHILASSSGVNRIYITASSVAITLNGSVYTIAHGVTITDEHSYKLTRLGTTLSLEVDTTPVGSVTIPNITPSLPYIQIGNKDGFTSSIIAYNGSMHSVKLTKAVSLFAFYKLDEGEIGSIANTVYDSSGNENHGVAINAPVYTSQDVVSYQNEGGYSLYYTQDDTLIASDITLTDMSFTINMRDATQRVILFTDSTISDILYIADPKSVSNTTSVGFGSPVYTVDGVVVSGHRGDLWDALDDGLDHDVVISNITYTGDLYYGGYNAASWGITSQVLSGLMLNGVAYEGDMSIPRNESNTALDVLGNPLQFTGRAKPRAIKRENNCIVLDGATQYGRKPVTPPSYPFSLQISGEPNTAANDDRAISLCSSSTSNRYHSVSFGNTGAIGIDRRNTTSFREFYTSPSVIETVKVTFISDTSYDIYVNGELLESVTGLTSVSLSGALNTLALGVARVVTPAGFFDGKLWDAQYSIGGALQNHLPLSEGVGDYSFDLLDTTPFTWINSPTWPTQDVFAHNWEKGCNKYTAFDGANSVNIPDDESLRFGTGDFTVHIEGYIPKFSGSSASPFEAWIGKGDIGAGEWMIRMVGASCRFFASSDRATMTIPEQEYVKITYARRSGVIYSYLEAMPRSNSPCPIDFVTPKALNIGRADTGSTRFFTGFIGNVYIYKGTGLDDVQVASLVATGDAGVSPTSHWTGYGADDWNDKVGANNATFSSADTARVPALNGTDAIGQPVRNLPVIGHNDAEGTLDFKRTGEGDTFIPETSFMPTSFETVEFGVNWSSFAYAFVRHLSDAADDRHIIYTEDLTGSDLEKLIEYTKTPQGIFADEFGDEFE